MNAEEFVRKLLPEARRAVKAAGLSDAVVPAVLAQVALETGWLRSVSRDCQTRRDSHNLFNIKATGNWNGDTVEIVTTEFIDQRTRDAAGRAVVQKRPVQVKARFRAYPSYEASFADYLHLITGLPRYQAAAKATDPFTYAAELQRAGYATDPLYAQKIGTLIRMIQPIIERMDREDGQ